MNISLDSFTVHCTDITRAADFYENVFAASVDRHGDVIDVDLQGVGRLRLAEGHGADTTFPGFVITYILGQPSEVRTVMDAVARHGAQVLKPVKKALFGSFSGAIRSPDGAIWKLAADSGKDTAPPAAHPRPTEATLILGVADPKATKAFYAALGMQTDRDYGSKYIDFQPVDGAARLCLMQSPVLAKDVGLTDDSAGASPITLIHETASSAEIDAAASAAAAAGGRTDSAVSAAGGKITFADPDGFGWVLGEDQR